jgi:hypothetical protein
MQPSPYDRTAAFVRLRFRRQPIGSAALLLACLWIVLNVYEAAANWSTAGAGGWFEQVTTTVSFCAIGVVMVTALAWLIEHVFSK